jgi:tetraacyldisaccharide 4'-kinase
MPFSERLIAAWYRPRLTALTALLWPASLVFRAAVAIRRLLYRAGILESSAVRAPVVIVGSIVVGGSGKTPFVRALALSLADAGLHPGLVARGYGGGNAAPRRVRPDDDASIVGDESLILAADGFPVWIGRDRVAAARALLAAHAECDVVLTDDGLQHYALRRDFEIAVIDDARGLGNGCMLPAGPLREPVARLRGVNSVVRLVDDVGASTSKDEGAMSYETLPWRNVVHPDVTADPEAWHRGELHAVAGIGDPPRFFALLRRLGFNPVCHAFPDHHRYTRGELAFPGATAILMTEKDAVKCRAIADGRLWYLPIRARIDPALVARVARTIRGRQTA